MVSKWDGISSLTLTFARLLRYSRMYLHVCRRSRVEGFGPEIAVATTRQSTPIGFGTRFASGKS